MYNKTDKRRLYWLIDQYLSDNVDENAFCNDFHDTLVNGIYYEELSKIENEVFHDLLDVAQRFSDDEESFKLWSGFVTTKQLREKVVETKEKLKEQKVLYDRTIKRKLYCFIDQYLSNKIDAMNFCNEFHSVLLNKVYYDGLTDIEYVAFCDLDDVAQCFIDNDEYFKLWSGYITAKQLREKVVETKEKLKSESLNRDF